MTYLAALTAVAAAMLLPLIYAAVTAPEGWEDEDGFHLREGVSYTHDTNAGAA